MNVVKPKLARHCLATAAAIALLATSNVVAQDVGPDENITVYQPTFFEEYYPVTALDMVRQVPGFSIQDGGRARGFGSTPGNVLIDGERPSSKSTSLGDILTRIPVERVVRIELVSGAVAGLDMRGQTRVVNVVLAEGSQKSQTTWRTQVTHWGNRVVPSGEVIQSFQWLGADISIGLQRNAGSPRRIEAKQFSDAGGLEFERRLARSQRFFREWQPHFTVARKFDNGDTLNLNGKYFNFQFDLNRVEETDVLTGGGFAFDRFDFSRFDNAGNGAEIGGDYEHKIGQDKSLKFIFFQRSDKRAGIDTFETFDTGGFDNTTRIASSSANNESILRSVFNWKRNPKNSFEASVEGAYNWLKAGLDIETDTGNGFQPIILPVANTKVEERRAEAAISWVAKPANGWVFELGTKYEISEISQSGDASNARTFNFLKPNFSLTWDRNKRDQVRMSVERVVGQLNFQNFATSVNITDDQTNVGNVELRPDSTWIARFAFERKFGKKGVLILNARHEWLSDVPDLVPFNNQFDAPGNIGDGRAWEVSADARIPTDRVGLNNGILSLRAGFGNSTVTDPLTGLKRVQSFRVDDFVRIAFRQDITKRKIAWGFDYTNQTPFQAAFLFNQRETFNGIGALNGFIETTKINNVTINLSVQNVLNSKQSRIRTNFDGPRNLGLIDNIEARQQQSGRVYRLVFRGTF